jgi:RNA polymerase sigma-70 factor, ECF subfamily
LAHFGTGILGLLVTPSSHEVTGLLRAWSGGDRAALERLVPLVYAELRRIARQCLARERPGHELETRELVNEAYLKLVDASRVAWQDRTHFFAISARLMRRILVDFARSRHYLKRGGGARDLSLDEALTLSTGRDDELVTLDEALNSLSLVDARKGQVVELRFFGGLSVEETAEALKISANTVRRDWKFAKLWLAREMSHVA